VGERWERWRGWRRRLSLVVLVVGVGFLVIRLLRIQPVELQVTYHYGAARQGLVRTVIRYMADGEELRRVSFGYARRPAGATQLHRLELPRGDYAVELELHYRGEAPREVSGRCDRPGTVHIRRPLLIRDEGAFTIYVAD
jgi:hypothetical protein